MISQEALISWAFQSGRNADLFDTQSIGASTLKIPKDRSGLAIRGFLSKTGTQKYTYSWGNEGGFYLCAQMPDPNNGLVFLFGFDLKDETAAFYLRSRPGSAGKGQVTPAAEGVLKAFNAAIAEAESISLKEFTVCALSKSGMFWGLEGQHSFRSGWRVLSTLGIDRHRGDGVVDLVFSVPIRAVGKEEAEVLGQLEIRRALALVSFLSGKHICVGEDILPSGVRFAGLVIFEGNDFSKAQFPEWWQVNQSSPAIGTHTLNRSSLDIRDPSAHTATAGLPADLDDALALVDLLNPTESEQFYRAVFAYDLFNHVASLSESLGLVSLVSTCESFLGETKARCKTCGQDVYKLTKKFSLFIEECVGVDLPQPIAKWLKEVYSKRSQFVHGQLGGSDAHRLRGGAMLALAGPAQALAAERSAMSNNLAVLDRFVRVAIWRWLSVPTVRAGLGPKLASLLEHKDES